MDRLPFLYITAYPLIFWLTGLVVGGGLGWLAAYLLRAIFKAWPAGNSLSMILPWRTLVFTLLWMLWSPLFYFAFHVRGLPPVTYDFVQIGASLALLTFIVTLAALVRHWFPSSLVVRLVSGARSLAVVAVMVATLGIGTNASENFVHVIRVVFSTTFDTSIIWQGWLVVSLAMLTFDLLPGVLQTILAFLANRRNMPVPA
jgi:hypothetical protein